MTKSTNRGFTLIELLVVISIIAFLSSIVLAALSGARTNARNGRIKEEVFQLRDALEILKNSDGTYGGLTINSVFGSTGAVASVNDTSSSNLITDIASTTGGVLGSATGPLTLSGGSNNIGIAIFTNTATSPTQYAIYATLGPSLGYSGYYCLDSRGYSTSASSGGANIVSGWWPAPGPSGVGQGSSLTAGTCQ